MAEVIKQIASAPTNKHFGDNIVVINQLLEDVSEELIPRGSVDILVSEPIGTLLFNERMVETYLRARDRFLKPGGRMFPRAATLSVAPFSDPILWQERVAASSLDFWRWPFFGVDL